MVAWRVERDGTFRRLSDIESELWDARANLEDLVAARDACRVASLAAFDLRTRCNSDRVIRQHVHLWHLGAGRPTR